MRPVALVALFLLVLSGCNSSDAASAPDEAANVQALSPIGLWVVPASQAQEANARAEAAGKNFLYLRPAPFYFHGDSATMQLTPWKAWMWRSEDDYYRVKTKWVNEELHWLAPFGGWSKQATFRNGRFELEGDDVVWIYERVAPKNVRDDLLPLLKKREIHDYSITPLGGRDPGRLKDLE
jgi:hypothetical protein